MSTTENKCGHDTKKRDTTPSTRDDILLYHNTHLAWQMLTLEHVHVWLDTYVVPKLLAENISLYMRWGRVALTTQDEFPYNAIYEDEPALIMEPHELVALFLPRKGSIMRHVRAREEGRHAFCLDDAASVRVAGDDTFVFSKGRYVLRHMVDGRQERGSIEIMRFETIEKRWCYYLLQTLVWQYPAHWENVFESFMGVFQQVDDHPSIHTNASIMTTCCAHSNVDMECLLRIYRPTLKRGRSKRCVRWLQHMIVRKYRQDKEADFWYTEPLRFWYLSPHEVAWVWNIEDDEEATHLLGRCRTIESKIKYFWNNRC